MPHVVCLIVSCCLALRRCDGRCQTSAECPCTWLDLPWSCNFRGCCSIFRLPDWRRSRRRIPRPVRKYEVFKIYLNLWMIQSVSLDLFDSQFLHCSQRNGCIGHCYLGPDIGRCPIDPRKIASLFLRIWRWERAYVYVLSKIRWLLLGLLKST